MIFQHLVTGTEGHKYIQNQILSTDSAQIHNCVLPNYILNLSIQICKCIQSYALLK